MEDRNFDDLEDGHFETPRAGGTSDGSTGSWRSETAGRGQSVIASLLSGSARRISDQFAAPYGQGEPLPDVQEDDEDVEEEIDTSAHEESKETDGDAPGTNEADLIALLKAELAALHSANARLRKAAASKPAASTPARAPTAHASKFVRATAVPDSDMLETQVTLAKANYGEPGSSDFRKNMALATAALHDKFGVAKHKVLTDIEEGDQNKSMHVQQVIVSVLHRVKEGKQRATAMDWMGICVMPHLLPDISISSSADPSGWWDSSEVCIWTDWEQLTEDEVRAWQYCINKWFGRGDQIGSTWLKDFVYASSTDALRTAVEKKYEKLLPNQRGGVTYLFYTLTEMFSMSREVKEAMIVFLDLFKRKGIARYSGENVLVASEEVIGVCKRLDAAKGLLEEHVIDVLTGLSICSNSRFKKMFEHLKQSADLGNMAVLDTIKVEDPPLIKIQCILDKAVDTYDKLCVAQTWIRITKGNPRALSAAAAGESSTDCWNCGGSGHMAGECPKPKDPATYNRNRKAFRDALQKKRDARSGNGGGKEKSKSGADYQRKLWDKKGLSMVNGTLMVKCKTCGFNTTHSTKYHDDWSSNPSGFKLKANHPYTQECAKLGISPGQSAPAAPPAAPPAAAPASAPAGSAGALLTIDRAQLEQKISNFERNSTNPSASDVSEAIRALLLN